MSKTCLITGVGPGTGRAIVNRFVEGGYRVAMLARNEERLSAIATEHGDAVRAGVGALLQGSEGRRLAG